jgi:hypothetical protein
MSNDIDFDELDRAVNSLTGGVPRSASPGSASDTLPVKRIDGIRPAPPAEPRPSGQPSITTMPSHRMGRLGDKPSQLAGQRNIIDIMAPKPVRPTLPSKAPSHTGNVVQPLSTHEVVKAAHTALHPEPPEEADQPAIVPDAVIEPAKAEPHIPESKAETEPELPGLKPKPELKLEVPEEVSKPEPEPKPAPEHESKPAQTSTPVESWPDPLDFNDVDDEESELPVPAAELATPFLPDTKVPKRPLGAFASAEPSPEPIRTEHGAEPAEAPEPKHEAASEPHQSLDQHVREQAQLSIPQQYHVANKDADATAHPVYDTKDYHPPLLEETSASTRRARLWWVMIALLVVAIVAVGGGIAYILMTQRV